MKYFTKILFILVLCSGIIILAGCCKKDNSAQFKDKIDQYVKCWNTGNFDGIEELLTENFQLFESPLFEPQTGIDAFQKTVNGYRTAYPDFQLKFNELVFDEDKVAGIWTITATNTGPGEKLPTGRQIKVTGMAVIHFEDGKIKDEWISGNDYHWLLQLGYTFLPPSTEEIIKQAKPDKE